MVIDSQRMCVFRRISRVWRLVFCVPPDILVLTLFTAIFVGLFVVYGKKITVFQTSIVFPLVSMMVVISMMLMPRFKQMLAGDIEQQATFRRLAYKIVRNWIPFVLIILVYENLHELTWAIRPDTVDPILRSIDKTLFSVDLALALEKIVTPSLTEYMTFCYALYFLFPALFLGIMYTKNDIVGFKEFALALGSCFYLGFVGYVLVPVVGPRYFMADQFTIPLTGIWLTERATAMWNSVESVQRDCFPSLHTAISTLSLIYLWRYRKVWFLGRLMLMIFTPLIVSLWVSTIYLRYHWGSDLLAGWGLAVFCSWGAPVWIKWYYRVRFHTVVIVSTDHALNRSVEPNNVQK